MTPIETMALPEDPTLAAYAAALNETGPVNGQWDLPGGAWPSRLVANKAIRVDRAGAEIRRAEAAAG